MFKLSFIRNPSVDILNIDCYVYLLQAQCISS